MTTPVVKRRRDITVHPPVRRRESSPAEATVAGETREGRAKHDGQELADPRTLLRRALGGSRRDCPGRQENGAGGSRESGPRRAGIRPTSPFPLRGRECTAQKEEDECAITSEWIGRIRRTPFESWMSAG